MSLFATKVMVFSCLLRQLLRPSRRPVSLACAPDSDISRLADNQNNAKRRALFNQSPSRALQQVPQVLIVFSTENPASHTSGAIVAFEPGARTRGTAIH